MASEIDNEAQTSKPTLVTRAGQVFGTWLFATLYGLQYLEDQEFSIRQEIAWSEEEEHGAILGKGNKYKLMMFLPFVANPVAWAASLFIIGIREFFDAIFGDNEQAAVFGTSGDADKSSINGLDGASSLLIIPVVAGCASPAKRSFVADLEAQREQSQSQESAAAPSI